VQPELIAPAPNLQGQVAVVTGGAGAIGRAVAARLLAAGASVVVGDLGDAADHVASAHGDPSQLRAHSVDVRVPESVHALIADTVGWFGRIDVMVNAAGITHVNDLLELPLEVWRNVMAVNLDGALLCIQEAARIMATQDTTRSTACRGKIINISSQGAEFPIPTSVAYGASKRALNYLTETAGAGLADRAISVTAVYPGMVYDGMWRSVNLERSRLRNESFDDRIRLDLADTPNGRFQDPTQLADIVLFVAGYVGLGLNGKTVWSEPHVA
jgi:NAD(P)-dependent dehydrogenase (short-subunit alcohol dehydrogenase family)